MAMAQRRVVSTNETYGRLGTPQLEAVGYAKAVTLTGNDMQQDWR